MPQALTSVTVRDQIWIGPFSDMVTLLLLPRLWPLIARYPWEFYVTSVTPGFQPGRLVCLHRSVSHLGLSNTCCLFCQGVKLCYFVYLHLSEYFNSSISQLVKYTKNVFFQVRRNLCDSLVFRINAHLSSSGLYCYSAFLRCIYLMILYVYTFSCFKENTVFLTPSFPPSPIYPCLGYRNLMWRGGMV